MLRYPNIRYWNNFPELALGDRQWTKPLFSPRPTMIAVALSLKLSAPLSAKSNWFWNWLLRTKTFFVCEPGLLFSFCILFCFWLYCGVCTLFYSHCCFISLITPSLTCRRCVYISEDTKALASQATSTQKTISDNTRLKILLMAWKAFVWFPEFFTYNWQHASAEVNCRLWSIYVVDPEPLLLQDISQREAGCGVTCDVPTQTNVTNTSVTSIMCSEVPPNDKCLLFLSITGYFGDVFNWHSAPTSVGWPAELRTWEEGSGVSEWPGCQVALHAARTGSHVLVHSLVKLDVGLWCPHWTSSL